MKLCFQEMSDENNANHYHNLGESIIDANGSQNDLPRPIRHREFGLDSLCRDLVSVLQELPEMRGDLSVLRIV